MRKEKKNQQEKGWNFIILKKKKAFLSAYIKSWEVEGRWAE